MEYRIMDNFPLWKSNGKMNGKPKTVTIHNTANSAPAVNEISYMQTSDSRVSFHFAADETEAIQGMPLDFSTWHSGSNEGNNTSISIEICRSLIKGDSRYPQAEENGAELAAKVLHDFGLTIDALRKHQDWNGKYCPHRILDGIGWPKFKEKVRGYLNKLTADTSKPEAAKPAGPLYRTQAGPWGSLESVTKGAAILKAQGFSTHRVTDGVLFYVQTGAFSTEANAKAEGQMLTKFGHAFRIVKDPDEPADTDTGSEQILYRLQAGPWGSMESVKKGEAILEEQGFMPLLVKDGAEYFLQVGAFSTEAKAQALAKELAAKGHAYRIK